MIELNDIPRCPCGHEWETSQIEGYAARSTGFHFVTFDLRCPQCERIASRYGYLDTCLNLFVVSTAEYAACFDREVVNWVRDVLNGIIAKLFREGLVDTPPSLTNPHPSRVLIYTPNATGEWVSVAGQ